MNCELSHNCKCHVRRIFGILTLMWFVYTSFSSYCVTSPKVHHRINEVHHLLKLFIKSRSFFWILEQSNIIFSMAAGLIGLHMSGVKCVTKASACQHTFIHVLRFVVNMLHCGRVAFTVFKQADSKGVKQRFTSTASLDDAYCEATIPVDMGHHVT